MTADEKRDVINTREKIIAAGVAIMTDGDGEKPSVRAVAARAGVGASTLRHYFPTQRALLDAILTALYEEALPDDRIRDTSIPARERLTECMWRMLDPVGGADQAREVWTTLFNTFISLDATAEARAGFPVIARQAEVRVAAWLALLEAEGALAKGDNVQRTHFLLTVVDGLSIERAFPVDGEHLEAQAATLAMAVDAVLGSAGA